jgi:hypothetical protein
METPGSGETPLPSFESRIASVEELRKMKFYSEPRTTASNACALYPNRPPWPRHAISQPETRYFASTGGSSRSRTFGLAER